ncbi:MAG: iron-sulfur cluster assembly protein [Chloroflexota bacterium]
MSEETPTTLTWKADASYPELSAAVRKVLRHVMDTELGLNIVELGLVRDVEINEEEAHITMILTTPFCPYGPALLETTRQKGEEVLKRPTTIEMGVEMWEPSMMEEGSGGDWGLF